jgi:hypothetical protein
MRCASNLFVLGLLLFGCNGGGPEHTSQSRDPNTYLTAVAQHSGEDPRRALPDNAPCGEIVEAMRESADTWLEIEAPPAMAFEHNELGRLLHVAAEQYAELHEACLTDPAALPPSIAYRDWWNVWCNKLVDEYRVDHSACE